MEHAATDLRALAWFAGWLFAVAVLFLYGLRLPLQTRWTSWKHAAFSAAVVIAGVTIALLANVALTLHDLHLDFTRERIYTPSSSALRVIEGLRQPVRLTYFYRGQDPEARRVKDVLEVMARRNSLLELRTVDPDREPALAKSFGGGVYNAGMLEAAGRRLLVQTTDENEIVIGIQRVLREKVVTVCFLEGHNELPMDNFEFHTHVEGAVGHSHGDASSQHVQMPGHGIGRLRRALEAQGYVTQKLVLATSASVPDACQVLIVANPRTTFLPAESAALQTYLSKGGALFAMFDLGFVLEPRLADLMQTLGVQFPQEAVIDPSSHFATDAETVAVASYEPGPITRNLSMSFLAGVRPLVITRVDGLTVTPLLTSSRDSYTRAVRAAGERDPEPRLRAATSLSSHPGSRVLAASIEGRLPGATLTAAALRVVIVGDGDFASNSFLPYLANSDLALAIVRWLVREERTGAVASRIPVPPTILLTSAQMRGIFLALVVALPLCAFAAGGLIWWRRR